MLFDLANEVNKTKSPQTAGLLKALAGLLGLLQRAPNLFLQADAGESSGSTLDIDALIIARNAAKQAKNYAEADQIRKTLTDAGIVLEDTAQGTIWRRA